LLDPPFIYNGSDKPWTVSFSFTTGGVNNINDVNQYANTFTVTVEPQQNIPLLYRRSVDASISGRGAGYSLSGKVIITDFEHKSQCYLIKSVDGIWTQGAEIISNGKVFPVIELNSNLTTRNYGSIMLIRDSWSSAPPQSSFGPTC
jgi:hypothetical protein